ncbi:uncharacterized protein [Onthophagus taurus]|uniref:uncharacterized protein n=1 Tax=Onthophagus taurus TaxID=166361 RepID=UPI0039BE2971
MAEDGRSLSSSFGMSLPQWMKNKINNNDRTLLDQNTFSPPQTDDNFLYMSRFKRNQQQQEQKQDQISKLSSNILPHFDTKLIESANKNDECGLSVIKVAHQMVNSSKLTSKSAASTSTTIVENVLENSDDQPATEPLNFNRSLRRGSKSLPSSPLSSPKSQRKSKNRYFGTSTGMESGWILGGLLKKGALSQSVSVINEEDGGETSDLKHQTLSGKMKSASQLSIDADFESKLIERRKILREMNFYSPTST